MCRTQLELRRGSAVGEDAAETQRLRCCFCQSVPLSPDDVDDQADSEFLDPHEDSIASSKAAPKMSGHGDEIQTFEARNGYVEVRLPSDGTTPAPAVDEPEPDEDAAGSAHSDDDASTTSRKEKPASTLPAANTRRRPALVETMAWGDNEHGCLGTGDGRIVTRPVGLSLHDVRRDRQPRFRNALLLTPTCLMYLTTEQALSIEHVVVSIACSARHTVRFLCARCSGSEID